MSTNIASTLPAEDVELRAKQVENYKLPTVVQLLLDGPLRYHKAAGILMGIFALGLARITETGAAKGSDANATLRTVTHFALVFNLCGVVSSLLIVKMCGDLQLTALRTMLSEKNRPTQQAYKDDPKWINEGSHGVPFAAAEEGTLATSMFDQWESFGMSPLFKWVVPINNWVVLFAYLCTAAVWPLEAFNTMSGPAGVIVLIISGFTTIIVTAAFIIAHRAQGWH